MASSPPPPQPALEPVASTSGRTAPATAAVPYRPRILDAVLDKHSTIPLYLQLKHHIVHLMSSGEWQPGMALPSVRQLASELGLATATVQRTYGELQAQGLLIGHTGRGVYVADLTRGIGGGGAPNPATSEGRALASERGAVLQEVLARAVSHARSLGFGESEIQAAVSDLLGGGRMGAVAPARVVFVGVQQEFLDKYHVLLREALAGLDVVVDTLLLADLAAGGDAALDALEPIACLISLVGTFPDLRRLADHRGTPLFGLVVDLTEETQHVLVHLPHETPIGLVAEERYMPSARAILRQYLGSEDHVQWATTRNRAGMGKVARECQTIVHTLGAKRVLEGLVPDDSALVELRFRPNPTSLARLRSLVSPDEGAVSGGRNGHGHAVRVQGDGAATNGNGHRAAKLAGAVASPAD